MKYIKGNKIINCLKNGSNSAMPALDRDWKIEAQTMENPTGKYEIEIIFWKCHKYYHSKNYH